MMYLPEGERLFVFASTAGAPTNSDWCHNLVANPEVHVEVGAESYEANAEGLTGAERDRVYEKQTGVYPFVADYQEKTGGRIIPVVALTRRS
jgi:deazaflavin-dependent oxidoreductase (nitroreductase family)